MSRYVLGDEMRGKDEAEDGEGHQKEREKGRKRERESMQEKKEHSDGHTPHT